MTFDNANNFVVNGLYQWDVRIDNANGGANRINGFEILKQWTSEGAFHNSGERYDPPKCHPDTRKAVLNKIGSWVDDPNFRSKILWLYGPAGAGKSAIAQTTAERFHGEGKPLAASFFFSRSAPERNSVKHFLPTIAYQLALSIPELKPFIEIAIEKDPSLCSRSLEVQMQNLVIHPLNSLGTIRNRDDPDLIIIDGLDECENPIFQRIILHTISEALFVHRPRLRFIVTSRPEQEIRAFFHIDDTKGVSTRLALDNSLAPEKDIEIFLQSRFDDVKRTHPLSQFIPKSWPSDKDIQTIIARSSGQFIYAATVMKYIEFSRDRPMKRLDIVLDIVPRGDDNPFAQLDALYMHIIASVHSFKHTSLVLGALLFHADEKGGSTTPEFLDKFLRFDEGDTSMHVSDLHSILDVPESPQSPIRIFHASLGDFLQDVSRSGKYFIEAGQIHASLTLHCLAVFPSHPMMEIIQEDSGSDSNQNIDSPMSLNVGYYAYHYTPHHCIRSTGTKELIKNLVSSDLDKAMIQEGIDVSIRTRIADMIFWLQTQSSENEEIVAFYRRFQEAFDEHHRNLIARYPQDDNLLHFLALATSRDGISLVTFIEKVLQFGDNYSEGYTARASDYLGIFFGGIAQDITEQYRSWLAQFLQTSSRAGKYYLSGDVYSQTVLRLLKCISTSPKGEMESRREITRRLTFLFKYASSSPELQKYIGTHYSRPEEDPMLQEISEVAHSYLRRCEDPSEDKGKRTAGGYQTANQPDKCSSSGQEQKGERLEAYVPVEKNSPWFKPLLRKICLPCL